MPHYYFDAKDGHRSVDQSGRNCENDSEAIAWAKVVAIGVSLDKPAVDPERYIAIIDNVGLEISRVPVYSVPSTDSADD